MGRIHAFRADTSGRVRATRGTCAAWMAGVLAIAAGIVGSGERVQAGTVLCDWDDVCYQGYVCYVTAYNVIGQKLGCGYEECRIVC